MAVSAMSQITDHDLLWKQSSLEEIRQLQRALHAEAAAKVEELRCLIGDKFRDLLQTTDAIHEMKKETDSAAQDIYALHSFFDEIASIIFKAQSSAAEKFDAEEEFRVRLSQSKQDQITVLFTPERVWESIDDGKLKHSVDRYHQGIEALGKLEDCNTPLWAHQAELLHDLPRQIVQACEDCLISTDESQRDEDAIRAVAAVENLEWKDALVRFLGCRFQGLQRLISSQDQVGRLAYSLRLTLSECYNWFGEPGKIVVLPEGTVRDVVSSWFQTYVCGLLLNPYSTVLMACEGDNLVSARDQILNVLFQNNTNTWPAAVPFCLSMDVIQLWRSVFYVPLEKAILHQAAHMFAKIRLQLEKHFDELEPSISKACDDPEFSVSHHRRSSTFWRQVMNVNQNNSDPFLVIVESIGERTMILMRSLAQLSHALLDCSVALSFSISDLVDSLLESVRSTLEKSCTKALFNVADLLEHRMVESYNANRSVLLARISRRVCKSALYFKHFLGDDVFAKMEKRYLGICLNAYQKWVDANAISITSSLRDRIEETLQIWKLLKPDQLSATTWATVDDVLVPCNVTPFAMIFLYDLSRQIQLLHCAEFDGHINAHVCAGVCVEVTTAISSTLDSVKSVSQAGKIQFLFDVLFIFAQINVPSHVLSSYGIPTTSSENVTSVVRDLRHLIEPVTLATLDQAIRESVRVQSARCCIIYGAIFRAIPSISFKAPSSSLNRIANIVPLLPKDVPRLPSLPVNLYSTRELKRPDLIDDLADSETQLDNIAVPTSPALKSVDKRDRSGLSSGVATSATKWLADASFGITTATSGLSLMFKHYSKQQQQQ